MLRLVPHFADRIRVNQDRTRIQLSRLGIPVESEPSRATVLIQVPADATFGRRLCASALIDYLVRLDPLVGEVIVDAANAYELLEDLSDRFPIEVISSLGLHNADIVVSVGALGTDCDLILDAAGWLSAVGELVHAEDDKNPIGPLATAALGAGEIFKLLFQQRYAELNFTQRLVPHEGVFSLYSYQYNYASPLLPKKISLDAILVGAGGVGAGVLVALAHLAGTINGKLTIIDADRLSWDNLNRVTYASYRAAQENDLKVAVAKRYIAAHAPMLDVVPIPEQYSVFTRRIPSRRDRYYRLVITTLDQDDVRWQVQRDLPHTLVDAATGIAANCRVERVLFGEHGCLGCSRPPREDRPKIGVGEECDAPPDPHAPSISFLSGFAGTLAAAEVIKLQTVPDAALKGYFEHVFLYPVNPEQSGVPNFHPGCRVDCCNPTVLQAYADKWTSGTYL